MVEHALEPQLTCGPASHCLLGLSCPLLWPLVPWPSLAFPTVYLLLGFSRPLLIMMGAQVWGGLDWGMYRIASQGRARQWLSPTTAGSFMVLSVDIWAGASNSSPRVSWYGHYNPLGLAICCGCKKGILTFPLLTGTLHFYFLLDPAKYEGYPRCVGSWQRRVDGIVPTPHASSRKTGSFLVLSEEE